uniref:Uncharacterized protein n=1 Tax=Setaria italica TaxID=4555 RepID=K3Z9T8_SETIT
MASIIIIAVVFVLDVLAFVLAIGAERRRSYRGHVREGLLRLQLRRVHGVRRQRAAAAARRPGGRHGRHPLLLLRPRPLAGTLAGMVRHLLRRLLAHIRDRGVVLAGGIGPERIPHQVHPEAQRQPACLRDAPQGRLRRRRRLHLPHGALHRAPLPLLRQITRHRRRAAAHRRRHRHDPHVIHPWSPLSFRLGVVLD